MENSNKIILDLCGGTGSWSKPYKDAGYDVRLITLPDNDVLTYEPPENVYGILAAPPCTEFSKASHSKKWEDRDFKSAMLIVKTCLNVVWRVQESGTRLEFWAIENPMGYLYNFLGKPAFYFQPWQFGEQGFLATKRTGIWGYFRDPVKTTKSRTILPICSHKTNKDEIIEVTIPMFDNEKRHKENNQWYTSSAEKRSITPPGFALAFFKANK